MDTLVLNKNFFAIQITNWKRALSLLYLGHAAAVDEEYRLYDFESWREVADSMTKCAHGAIITPNFSIPIPDVISLRLYSKLPPMTIKFTRRNIYEHYDFRCCYCGTRFSSDQLNLEHIIPRSRGGKSDWENVVTACIECNTRKANRLPHEAGMALRIKPSKPGWRGPDSLLMRSGIKIRASWQRFIDTCYWDGELKI
ncbi:TPA: HNH endonuclease [bacterium]|nr:MAG: hypothetical protein AUJ18_04700 [Candidatus Hydrogenedentes bacterium CG1_02_42_14]PIU47425.1 MAG: HNH endonuclease [Candidatus Hydrogenedentes bacterium CG07_land_8_20_14_0_80_42_17]HBW47976.1 HNH endonuclease [bacterium]